MADGFPVATNFDNIASGPVAAMNRGDPADWLRSETAIERLLALRQRVADCRALLTPSEVMRELYQDKAEMERRIDELTKPAGVGGKNGISLDAMYCIKAEGKVSPRSVLCATAVQAPSWRFGTFSVRPDPVVCSRLHFRSPTFRMTLRSVLSYLQCRGGQFMGES
jgi:hypothetical protein